MYESPIKEFFRSSLKNFNFMIGAIMFFSILVLAVFADQIAPIIKLKFFKLLRKNSTL